MIIFDLACMEIHRFEGWFRSSEDFDKQLENGMVSCPQCGSSDVRRLPSAVHLSKTAKVSPGMPKPTLDDVSETLASCQDLAAALLARYEDVGENFTEEARKIHYMENPRRSIRGEASNADYEALREDGIDVIRVAAVKKRVN